MKAFIFILACGLMLMVGSLGFRPPPLIRLRGTSARRLQALGNDAVAAGATAGTSASSEEPITLAFFVQISDSTIDHLPRLLRRIWEPCNLYAIHVDAKASGAGVLRSLRERLHAENGDYASNVHFMEPELITYRGMYYSILYIDIDTG